MKIGHCNSSSSKNAKKDHCDALIILSDIYLINLKILSKCMEGIVLTLHSFCGTFRRSPKAHSIFYSMAPQLDNEK